MAGGSRAWRYELILCTKVDLPAPAIPMAIIVTGFFFPDPSAAPADVVADDEDASIMVLTKRV